MTAPAAPRGRAKGPVDPRLWKYSRSARGYLIGTVALSTVVTVCIIVGALAIGRVLAGVITDPTARSLSAWTTELAVLAGAMAVRVLAIAPPRRADLPWKLVLANSGFDAAGMSFFLLATREGMVSVVSVLAALYPASTVGLAVVVLKERFTPAQLFGVALAAAAVIAIVVG